MDGGGGDGVELRGGEGVGMGGMAEGQAVAAALQQQQGEGQRISEPSGSSNIEDAEVVHIEAGAEASREGGSKSSNLDGDGLRAEGSDWSEDVFAVDGESSSRGSSVGKQQGGGGREGAEESSQPFPKEK